MNTIGNQKTPEPETRNARGFTLIELLVVISIIGVLAGFTIPVLMSVKRQQYIKVARAELEQLQTALENYKAKYGVYPPSNQNLASSTYQPALLSQLYYELSGVTRTTIGGVDYYVTLDGSAQIAETDVPKAYGVGGFINATKGTGEDAAPAQNFLSGLKANQLNSFITNGPPVTGIRTTELVTAVGGPDQTYQPLGGAGINPFRYLYPGTNNPGSYDLWVQLVIRGKTNLICNWSKQVLINAPLP